MSRHCLGTSPRSPLQAAVGYIYRCSRSGEHHPNTAASLALEPGPAQHLGRLCRKGTRRDRSRGDGRDRLPQARFLGR